MKVLDRLLEMFPPMNLLVIILMVAGWLTNVVWLCNGGARTIPDAVIGSLGIPLAPLGVAHGVFLWFQ